MPSDRSHIVRATFERRQTNRAKLARLGWHQILSDEVQADPLFEEFFTRFFPEGLRSTPIPRQLPSPYITWNVSDAMMLGVESPELCELLADLHRNCLAALKASVSNCQPWFVVENIQHTWYRIHFDEVPADFDDWPVDLLPISDPCYLFARDFSCGIFSELDSTVSIFGEELLSQIDAFNPRVLSTVIRSQF